MTINKEKLKWLFVVLLIYIVLQQIPLLDANFENASRFEFVQTVVAGFVPITAIGLGSIMMAGMAVQLLSWIGLKKIGDAGLKKAERLLAIVVILLGSFLYADNFFVALKLIIGSLAVLILVEFSQLKRVNPGKTLLSGTAIFIAANIIAELLLSFFNPFPNPQNPVMASGRILAALQYLMQQEYGLFTFIMVLAPVLLTIIALILINRFANRLLSLKDVSIPLAVSATQTPIFLYVMKNLWASIGVFIIVPSISQLLRFSILSNTVLFIALSVLFSLFWGIPAYSKNASKQLALIGTWFGVLSVFPTFMGSMVSGSELVILVIAVKSLYPIMMDKSVVEEI